jgi:transcriptional regulator
MTLTRKERESLVIDFLNRCTPIREIASRAGLSYRDIGAVKKKAEEQIRNKRRTITTDNAIDKHAAKKVSVNSDKIC